MSSSLIAVRDDGRMSSPGPRSGGPAYRRSFTSTQKLEHLAAYEAAAQNGQGGAPPGCRTVQFSSVPGDGSIDRRGHAVDCRTSGRIVSAVQAR